MSPKKSKDVTIEKLMEQGLLKKGSDESFIIQRIPFGLPDLDEIVSGGIPRDRITILTGTYSAGKSFLLQLLIKQGMEQSLKAAYIDTERSFDPIWWKQIGINVDDLLVSQPPTGEATINVVIALAESGFDIIAIDSLAGMIPAEIEEAVAEQKFIASQAKVINRLMQKLLSTKHNAAIICTNQLRGQIGPGPVDTMPGGWGQLFYGHLLLRVFREGWIEDKGERIGFDMKIVCRKSKVGRGYRECILPFLFRGAIDKLALLMDRAIEAGLIEQTSAWYSIFGGDKMMGRNTVLEAIGADKKLQQRLEKALGEEK